jgi:hypothetical protein
MHDGAQFIILCEDVQAQSFLRRALIRRGVNRRRIYARALPSKSDGGAGEAYVVAKYPVEVPVFRSMAARAATGLLVHVDADSLSIVDRHDKLAAALKDRGQRPREEGEAIAELVPKRNIETWIYALDGELASRHGVTLDEETDFRKLRQQRACAAAAEAFADHIRHGTRPETATVVPSLLDGLKEFGRLP